MLHLHQALAEKIVLPFDGVLFAFELFDFLALALSRRLGCLPIAQHPLNATLLLFIFGLCTFARSAVSMVCQ